MRRSAAGHKPNGGCRTRRPAARLSGAGGYRDGLIACGPLLSESGAEWLGTAMLAARAAAEAMMAEDPTREPACTGTSRFTTDPERFRWSYLLSLSSATSKLAQVCGPQTPLSRILHIL